MPLRSFALALCLALAAGPTLADVSPEDLKQAAKRHEKGVREMQKGKLDKAAKEFRRALDYCPMLPQAHLALGHLAMQRQDFEQAYAHYGDARKGYGDLGALLFEFDAERYSTAQSQIHELRDAIRMVNHPANKMTDDQKAAALARFEAQIRQLEVVEHPRERAEREAPGEVYFFLGNSLFRLGRLAEATEAWETCAQLSPEFPLVRNNLALAYWKQGRVQQARESLELAEQLGFSVHPRFKADLNRSLTASASR